MTSGLATTFETLIASRNHAANPVLLAALKNTDSEVYEGALKAVIARRNKAGHLAVLQQWHQLTPVQREYLQEGRGRMSGALRDAVLSDDDQLFENACELVVHFKEFDLTSTLVTLAENQKDKHAEAATQLVLQLVHQLSEMVHGRDHKDRGEPERLSRIVLETLERSVERYRTHKRNELIEAFVILGGPQSNVLREILDEPHHPCYLTVINTLTNSRCAGVIQLLLGSLQSEYAPLSLLNVISKRDDLEFVTQLLALTESGITAVMAKNLARIRSFVWLQRGERGFNRFDQEQQASCIKLIAASGVKPDEFLDLLEGILKRGEPVARWAACEALASIPGDRGNQLVLNAVTDYDPLVQAAATRQVRDRHVPGAMAILLRQIKSPHQAVRDATYEALAEFTFESFLAGFEGLQDEVRSTIGALVKKVDPKTVPGVLAEMKEKSRTRRLRALEMAEVMDLAPQVVNGILTLLEDEDHLVRCTAADILQFCPTAEVQQALRNATSDRSSAVQNAAQNSLEVFDDLARAGNVAVANFKEGQE